MSATNAALRASVVYAKPERQFVIELELAAGATVADAIEQSGLRRHCPELQSAELMVGRFHRRCRLDELVRDGDRIEVYRPLQLDPMEARRLRAARRSASR